MINRNRKINMLLSLVSLFTMTLFLISSHASALSSSNYTDHLIDDRVFRDSNSMGDNTSEVVCRFFQILKIVVVVRVYIIHSMRDITPVGKEPVRRKL